MRTKPTFLLTRENKAGRKSSDLTDFSDLHTFNSSGTDALLQFHCQKGEWVSAMVVFVVIQMLFDHTKHEFKTEGPYQGRYQPNM